MNDSHFKVGDEVAIRFWDDMAQEYGVDTTTGSIKCFCRWKKEGGVSANQR